MTERVRVAVQCVFRHEGRVLLFEQEFRRQSRRAWRAVGGGVEAGETLQEALAREVREELGREIESPRRLGVLEATHPWWGVEPRHVIHVFDARFADRTTYALGVVEGADADGTIIRARWLALEELDALEVAPQGLRELLAGAP